MLNNNNKTNTFIQIYLVTGGEYYGNDYEYLSSTELLTKGASKWNIIILDSLPVRLGYLGSASVDNQIITTCKF